MNIKEYLEIGYKILNDFQGSIIAIIAMIITYPILKKKLLETHISNALIDIQQANKDVILKSTELIDEYVPLTYTNEIISEKELENLSIVIKGLQTLSQNANKDCNTMIELLKITLQNTVKHYDLKKHGIITTREIYGLIIRVLEQVIYFSTQVVQIPKSSKTSKRNLINKKIQKYVTHSEFEKYKYFKQGFIDDAKSAHHLLFYSYVLSKTTKLITRSAFQIFQNTAPIQCIAYVEGIYAPMQIEKRGNETFFGDRLLLHLMGFKIKSTLDSKTNKSKKIIEFNYTNPSDYFRFTKSLSQEKMTEFIDSFIDKSNFDLSKMNKFRKYDNEIISLEFDYEYCKMMFKKNKRRVQKEMKKTVYNTS